MPVYTCTVVAGTLGTQQKAELAATLVLELPITEWSLKISAGWPEDPDDDVAGEAWAGVVPMTTGYAPPQQAPDLRVGIAIPESVLGLGSG